MQFVTDDDAPPLPPVLPVVLPLLVVVVVAAVAAAAAVALFGRSSRSALFYLLEPPMVVCAFGSSRACAWCFSRSRYLAAQAGPRYFI
jgi:hypothetical protein